MVLYGIKILNIDYQIQYIIWNKNKSNLKLID